MDKDILQTKKFNVRELAQKNIDIQEYIYLLNNLDEEKLVDIDESYDVVFPENVELEYATDDSFISVYKDIISNNLFSRLDEVFFQNENMAELVFLETVANISYFVPFYDIFADTLFEVSNNYKKIKNKENIYLLARFIVIRKSYEEIYSIVERSSKEYKEENKDKKNIKQIAYTTKKFNIFDVDQIVSGLKNKKDLENIYTLSKVFPKNPFEYAIYASKYYVLEDIDD